MPTVQRSNVFDFPGVEPLKLNEDAPCPRCNGKGFFFMAGYSGLDGIDACPGCARIAEAEYRRDIENDHH